MPIDQKTNIMDLLKNLIRKAGDGTYYLPVVADGGSVSFTELLDTPANYTGQAGNILKINNDEDGLIVEEDNKNGFDLVYNQDKYGQIAFDNLTRTFTIEPITGNPSFTFYVIGKLITKTSLNSVTIPDVTGTYYVYFDNDGILQYKTILNLDLDTFYKNAIVGLIYWNKTEQYGIASNERHGILMDSRTHVYNHSTLGARYGGGFNINGLASSNTIYTNIEIGTFWDEDIKHTGLKETTHKHLYKEGINGEWKLSSLNNTIGYKEIAANNYQYNEFNGTTWGLTEFASSDYTITFFVAISGLEKSNIYKIIGQNIYSKKADAREGINSELQKLNTDGLLSPEHVFLYAIITNGDGKLQTLDDGSLYLDFRYTKGVGGNTATVSNSFLGLTDTPIDYALQAGKVPVVKATEDGLEFLALESGGTELFTAYTKIGNTFDTFKNGLDLINQELNTTNIAISNIGSLVYSADKWFGQVLAPNGNIYGLPFSYNTVLKIVPGELIADTDVISQINTPASGTHFWRGGTLATDGKIYCAPCRGDSILIIDPETDILTENTDVLIGSLGVDRRNGFVQGIDGKLYGIPDYEENVLVFDPKTNIVSKINTSLGLSAYKFFGGCLAPNGKIYCAPYGSTQVLEIDTIKGTTQLVGSVHAGGYKRTGIIVGQDGNMYCVPSNTPNILKIEINADGTITTSEIPLPTIVATQDYFNGASMLPNGLIVMMAWRNDKHLIFNPFTQEITLSVSLATSGLHKWNGGCLAPNGKIYCTPSETTTINVVGEYYKIPLNMALNKYINLN